ncbi:7TM diverse intracellular signaling domain-containing protein [Flavobacterium sp. DGU11]|uniref:histidine kinase n=1 Tax=Flavobacterium arundinis TaxID=3139143 RepID=A0ABU9HY98_9FLAO
MRIIRIVLGALLFIAFQASAQKGLPPVFEIKSDTGERIVLDTLHFQILPNPAKEITLDDVLHENSDKHFVSFDASLFNSDKNTAWFRFRIKNSTGRDHIITFPGAEKRSDIYIKGISGKWKQFATGYKVPFSKRDGIKRSLQILFPLGNGEEITVYKKMEWSFTGTEVMPSVAIYDPLEGNFEGSDSAYFDTVISAALFGFMVFAALFNFFFYYIIRERVYLFYAITLLIAALFNISDPLLQVFLNERPGTGQTIQAFLMISVIILVLLTMRLFLHTKKTFPLWDKFLVYFPFVMIGIFILIRFMVPASQFSTVLDIAAFSLIVFYIIGILVILIRYLVRRDANARLLTVALIPFFIGILASMGDDFEWIMVCGLIWAVAVISWSLFARFRALMAENSRQAIEKEKLAREKEEERNALIAQQNEILEHQVAGRTAELSQSITDLKQTQAQLIQSEKMASLGELTAGIAHEIQNPLNFVNNFSDVSVELLQELKEELDKGDMEEVNAIADDVIQNLEKIAHHGRRADGIVKGMLQHSRASSGQKEPTDINALADEYLRLAYHGLRAKDKSFNAELVTNFDENLPKANVIP